MEAAAAHAADRRSTRSGRGSSALSTYSRSRLSLVVTSSCCGRCRASSPPAPPASPSPALGDGASGDRKHRPVTFFPAENFPRLLRHSICVWYLGRRRRRARGRVSRR